MFDISGVAACGKSLIFGVTPRASLHLVLQRETRPRIRRAASREWCNPKPIVTMPSTINALVSTLRFSVRTACPGDAAASKSCRASRSARALQSKKATVMLGADRSHQRQDHPLAVAAGQHGRLNRISAPVGWVNAARLYRYELTLGRISERSSAGMPGCDPRNRVHRRPPARPR
jgi:hypothetical protein